jgi:hypothetical protein
MKSPGIREMSDGGSSHNKELKGFARTNPEGENKRVKTRSENLLVIGTKDG